MGAILSDQHQICVLMSAIVPKSEYAGEIWEENAKFVKQLETVQMTAAKKIPGCSSTTSNTVLRAELGMYPLKTKRDARKFKWQYIVTDMPEKKLPAIVDNAVWEKKTKGRAGIKCKKVVENIWKGIGGDQGEILST